MSDVAAAPFDSLVVAAEDAEASDDVEVSDDEVSDAAEDAEEADWSDAELDDDPPEQAVIATAARMAISDVVSKRMYFSYYLVAVCVVRQRLPYYGAEAVHLSSTGVRTLLDRASGRKEASPDGANHAPPARFQRRSP